ncbi:hypothetical protein MNBD_PLANCTO02-1233 [hydrothermal vent metagenome]|uniref:Lipoprotein n=1 Tax=hydrothermal vent metagenome TaxID=652676 RepID=A0A3B1E7N8_9ZZZZ
MVKKSFLGLAAGLALTLFVGCSTTQGLVRGQSPVFEHEGYTTDSIVHEEGEIEFSEGEHCENCSEEISKLEYILKFYWLHGHHHDDDGGGVKNKFAERAGRFSRGESNVVPTYEHNYRVYRPRPEELKYAPQNSPGAVVQYPYYIHKSPDDFLSND